MFQSAFHFFGQTSNPNKEFFLLEIESVMYAYPGMSFWDAYNLPISIRKWLIRTYNKRMEDANKNQSKQNPPSSKTGQTRMQEQYKNYSANSSKISSFMKPQK